MRRKPYTARGIKRCRCLRCGLPAVHQWSACAVGNRFMPLCLSCDVGLNKVALSYVLGRELAKPLIERYARKQRTTDTP